MPTGGAKLAAWIHPILAFASLALLFYVASLGLRSRERGGAPLRPKHSRLAPLALTAMILNLVLGLLSTWLWRRDVELGDTPHFLLGCALVAVLLAAAWVSRQLPGDARARRIHPILGMIALLLALLQVFFGLPLLPL